MVRGAKMCGGAVEGHSRGGGASVWYAARGARGLPLSGHAAPTGVAHRAFGPGHLEVEQLHAISC